MKKINKAKRSKKSTLFWIWSVSQGIKAYVVLLIFVQIILSFAAIGFAWLLRSLIDCAVYKNETDMLIYAGMLIGLVIFENVFRAINRFLTEYARSGAENAFKSRLFSTILNVDYASVMAIHSGEWMNRLTSDTVVVADGLIQILPSVVGLVTKLVGAFVLILMLLPSVGYFALPAGLIFISFTYVFRKKLKQLHKKMQEADGNLRIYLSERLSCLMIVRAFSCEKATVNEAEQKMLIHRKARMRKNKFSNVCNVGFGLSMSGMYVLGAVYCAYGILRGTLSYGTYAAIMELVGDIQSPFANITGYLPKYYAMLASAERLMEAEGYRLDEKEILDNKKICHFYRNEFAKIVFHNINFAYQRSVETSAAEHDEQYLDGKEVIHFVISGMNLEIEKGKYIAFVGPSGCGKSTVLKLLMSLYVPDSGEKYILTSAGEQLPLTASWRGLFAYVPQGNQLMSGTIREVIAFGDRSKMQMNDALERALKISCAYEFVKNLEHGIDTVLGERGGGLSEGQMQRIAIARAVLSDRPILLLDEATSALDEDTEAQVLTNLREMTEKTVVIVTHRPAAKKIVDKCIEF